jgi:LacI family transcriptional regulator
MALGAINAAYKARISIPEDLLIVGFDDMPEAPSFCPPLTSIRQNFQVSGQLAVKELIRIIEDDPKNINPPRQHVLQPKLIIRQSTNR